MAPTASDLPGERRVPRAGRTSRAVVVTDARGAASRELSGRVRRYTLAMAFRLACFLSMAFVEGWLRWTLLAFAVFLPYVAVVLANQADRRSVASQVEHGAPEDAPALTSGADVVGGEVVDGEVVDGEVVEEPRQAYARPAA